MGYVVLTGGGILSLRGGPIIVQGGASKILRAFGALMIRPPPVKKASYAPASLHGRGSFLFSHLKAENYSIIHL